MKKYSLLTLLVLLTYIFVLSSCEKEELVEENKDLLSITSDSFQFRHTGAEVDQIIRNEYGTIEQSTPEEKMKLLSEIIVKNYYKNNVTSRTSSYVLTAQVFQRPTGNPADDIYTTDGAISNGTGYARARVYESPEYNYVQVASTANVYLNGNNISGKAFSVFNFSCTFDNRIDADASAEISGTTPSTYAFIKCDS